MPAPARWAAAAARWPAPVIPADPAITSTLADHLWAVVGRGGSHPATSAASTRPALAVPTSRPMSATTTVPARERPGSSTSPGFSAAKVTVRTAGSARPRSSPVVPSMPLGMSTASTGPPDTSGAWCSPRKPVP